MGRHSGNLPDYDYAAELRSWLQNSKGSELSRALRLAWMLSHGEGGEPDYWLAAREYGGVVFHYRHEVVSRTGRNLYLGFEHLCKGLYHETGRSDSRSAPDPDLAEAHEEYRQARKRFARAIKKDPKQTSVNRSWDPARSPAELAEARVELAFLLESGRGGDPDPERAAELRQEAGLLWPGPG